MPKAVPSLVVNASSRLGKLSPLSPAGVVVTGTGATEVDEAASCVLRSVVDGSTGCSVVRGASVGVELSAVEAGGGVALGVVVCTRCSAVEGGVVSGADRVVVSLSGSSVRVVSGVGVAGSEVVLVGAWVVGGEVGAVDVEDVEGVPEVVVGLTGEVELSVGVPGVVEASEELEVGFGAPVVVVGSVTGVVVPPGGFEPSLDPCPSPAPSESPADGSAGESVVVAGSSESTSGCSISALLLSGATDSVDVTDVGVSTGAPLGVVASDAGAEVSAAAGAAARQRHVMRPAVVAAMGASTRWVRRRMRSPLVVAALGRGGDHGRVLARSTREGNGAVLRPFDSTLPSLDLPIQGAQNCSPAQVCVDDATREGVTTITCRELSSDE